MNMTIETKEVRDIAKRFNYRKRHVNINMRGKVTLTDLNWSGGTRSTYSAYDLATGEISTPNFGGPAPWDNKIEGTTVTIPSGKIVVRTGTFCGKPSQMTIYCNPGDMPKFITEG